MLIKYLFIENDVECFLFGSNFKFGEELEVFVSIYIDCSKIVMI